MRRAVLVALALLLSAVLGPPWLAGPLGWLPDPSSLPAGGRRLEVGEGLYLQVREVGSGSPVVLVHGLPGAAADWERVPELLAARGHRVVSYDRVGYGRSSRVAPEPGRYTYLSNAHELGLLLDALGLERVALAGWSYGGAVVQTFAEHHPERVTHLALVGAVGPAFASVPPAPLDRLLLSPLGGPLMRWVSSLPPLSRRVCRDGLAEAFSGAERVPAGWVERMRALLAPPETQQAFLAESRRGDPTRLRPEAIRVPALVLQGEDDRLVPRRVAEDLRRRLPNATLVVVPGGSHMLPVTHPDRVARRLHELVSAR